MQPMTVGRIEFAPALAHNMHAEQAGDVTWVGYRRLPPVAANDNYLKASPPMVGLMGYAGSGKTTVANILRNKHGFQGPHIKRPLLHMAQSLLDDLGIPPSAAESYLDGDLKRSVIPELGITGTELQQQIGSWGRTVRDDLWLSCWLAAADRIVALGGRAVQESVRHTNEADSVRSRGGVIIEIRRPGVAALNNHESENIPATPDVIIDNGGSLLDLELAVDAAIASIATAYTNYKFSAKCL